MSEVYQSATSPEQVKPVPYELRGVPREVDQIFSEAMKDGLPIKIERLEGDEITLRELKLDGGSRRAPYSEVSEVVFTDGERIDGEWEKSAGPGSNPDGYTRERKVVVQGAAIVIERHFSKSEAGKDSYESEEYIVRAKDQRMMEEFLEGKKLPDLSFERYRIPGSVSDRRESVIDKVPREVRSFITEVLQKGGEVIVFELTNTDIRTQEIDEIGGSLSLNQPYQHKKEMVYTDGRTERGKTIIDRASGSNPNGEYKKNTVTVREARTIIIRDQETSTNRDGDEEERVILDIHTNIPEVYARLIG